ncbi:MAG: protein kinase [Bacteroides sp.]|nr:protein kinase [Eubacterium sp.]MCM1418242.1 protein kinase [Roseburia sp.]MCM1462376.1 protein kinase [Bacteroides sp.]
MTFEEKYRKIYTEEELPPSLADRYTIASCLRHSDTKQVYLIRENVSGVEYILKCAEGVYLPQLKKEYTILEKACTAIRCPKPVSYSEEGGRGYLVREYIRGETIRELVERECFTEEKAFEAIGSICEVLEKLHRLDPPVILRDIKPENVLYADGGYIPIDFDAAREWNEKGSADTEYMGTRATAAPEQFGYGQTDRRTDVYAVGMLLTYMLTGGYKLSAVSGRKARRIIQKCTQFSPDRRYKNTYEIRAALKGRGLIVAGLTAGILILAVGLAAAKAFAPPSEEYVLSPTNTFTFTQQAASYSDQMVADALAAIDRQNDGLVRAGRTKAEMIDYLLKNSRYAVFGGEEWPALATDDINYYVQYVEDTSLAAIDGTNSLKLDSLASASMSAGWFASGVVYTEEISLESYRIYPDGAAGEYDADVLKEYFEKHLQAGEHIRIDETRSMAYVSSDGDGFYFIEYGSIDNSDRFLRLRYYTYDDFISYLNDLGKNLWYYEVDESENP